MSRSSEGKFKSTKKVDSSINALDKEVDDALSQDSQAKNVELHQSNHESTRLVDDDFSPLSGKPFHNCIVTNSHLKSLYRCVFPPRMHQYLPSKTVPAVVACRGKTWNMMFLGNNIKKQFDIQSWKVFAIENDLKVGDALFWEVMENSDEKVHFKVQIIRGDFPCELEAKFDGKTEGNPIVID